MAGKSIRTSKIAVSLYLASCFFISCPIDRATAQQANIQTYADGWKLINPPAKVHIHDHFEPYFSIDIDSKPIDEHLGSDVHPMAKILNQYELIHIQPNPEKIEWNNDIKVNGLYRTVNIVTQFTSPTTPHPKKSLKPQPRPQIYGQKQSFIKKASRVTGVTLIAIISSPVLIVAVPYLSLFAIELFREDHDKKVQQKKLQKVFFQLNEFSKSIEALQQSFKTNTASGDSHSFSINNDYNVLPSKYYYVLNPLERTATYYPMSKWVELTIHFKKPYPKQEEVQKNFENSSFNISAKSVINFDFIDNFGHHYHNKKKENSEIIQCVVRYTNNYTDKTVSCEGAT